MRGFQGRPTGAGLRARPTRAGRDKSFVEKARNLENDVGTLRKGFAKGNSFNNTKI